MKKFLLMFACFGFAACSIFTPKERDVYVSDVIITGFLSDYVRVVPGSYKFTSTGRSMEITVVMELTKKPPKVCLSTRHRVRLNLIGEDHKVYRSTNSGFEAGGKFGNREEIRIEELLNGKIGDKRNIRFEWNHSGAYKEDRKAILTQAVSFEIIDHAFNNCN